MKLDKNIGGFVSEKGKIEFETAYKDAMKFLPKPNDMLDIDTDFGVVRVYHFFHAENKEKNPIVLLHGRSAATPMWADNLKGLIEERPVFSIDLLGEPGMSVQIKPLKNSKDQALWLSQVIKQFDYEKVNLLGVSIGGWTAMNLVRYFPEKIATVSLLDPVFVFSFISLKILLSFWFLIITIPKVHKTASCPS